MACPSRSVASSWSPLIVVFCEAAFGADGVQHGGRAPGREHFVGLGVAIGVLNEVDVDLGGPQFAGRRTARVVGQSLLLIDEADCVSRLRVA